MENKLNPPNDSLVIKSVRKNKKLSAQNKTQELEHDSFSDALLGAHLSEPRARARNTIPQELENFSGAKQDTLVQDEDTKSTIGSEMSPQGDFLDRVYPENILTNITQDHSPQKPIALPQEKVTVLLPNHTDLKTLTSGVIQISKKLSPPMLLLIAVIFVSYASGYDSYHIKKEGGDIIKNNVGEYTNPFVNIQLEGKAAYVYDVTTSNTLFEFNANDVLPLASLTKLMTAVIASEILPTGTVVTINKSDIESEGDSGLFMHERFKLSDIIGFTLMTSSNDGASALAASAGSLGQNAYGEPASESKQKFINEMNRKSQELGLRGTHFYNESGLDVDNEISGGYGTARDIAFLMAYVVKVAHKNIESTTLTRSTVTSLDNIRHQATNTNEEINTIPGIIASKTGYTNLAGGNLAIAFDAGLSRPVVVVVLGSTREGRFKDAEALTWAALEELKRK